MKRGLGFVLQTLEGAYSCGRVLWGGPQGKTQA